MRKINLIVLHCSDSDNPLHDDIEVIKDWHLKRGFSDVGYHYFIRSNGTLELGRDLDVQGAHARPFNAHSIAICLSGKKEFTDKQFATLGKLCRSIIMLFGLTIDNVKAHNEINPQKTCPNFSVPRFKNAYL